MHRDDTEREVTAFALEQAAHSARLAYVVALIIGVIAARGLPWPVAGGWCALVIATLLLRNRVLARKGLAIAAADGAAAARHAFNWTTLAVAVALGLLPALAIPLLSTEVGLLLTLFLCCWVAAGMSSLGIAPRLYAGYLAIVLGGLVAGWLRSGDLRNALTLTGGLVMYWLVLQVFSRNFSRRIREGIAIRAQNAELVRQLFVANEAKTRFIMAASHDLRQPLHAISLLGGVLARATDARDMANAREALNAAVSGLNGLFSAILDLSRIESGTVRPEMRTVAVDQLIARLDTEYRELCIDKNRRWECQAERAQARTDPVLLERIVRNLLDNALKHGGQGAVRLSVSGGDEVTIVVSDTGPGIPLHDQEHVFEEFYRGENGSGAGSGGLGLGLSIVKRLADLLGARLDIGFSDPAAATGASIKLVLPAGSVAGADGGHVTGNTEAPDVSGMRILAVDDEPAVLEATRALLMQWGCTAYCARGPEEVAAAVAQLVHPDVALVDYRLGPKSFGLDAVAAARAAHPDMGVIVVTGESDAAVLAQLEESGFPVLKKPVDPEELRLTLAMFRSVA
ncbi:MAG: hybrid sensor histidine kinase/response regulator [Burkholderiaceae bacterium]